MSASFPSSFSPHRIYLLAALFGLTFWAHGPLDPDLGWHLLGGAWTIAHSGPPRADFINAFAPYWHDYHWLGQVLMAEIYRFGGFPFLSLTFGLVMAVFSVVLAEIVLLRRSARSSEFVTLVVTAIALLSLQAIASIRPQIMSLLIVALAYRHLLKGGSKWELPFLFLLTALAVNIHVYWIFVPYLWFVWRCSPRFLNENTTPAGYAWGGFFLLLAAGMVSPYGLLSGDFSAHELLQNYAVLWDYLQLPPQLANSIREFRPTLAAGGIGAVVFLAALLIACRGARWKRIQARPESSLTAATGFVLAFTKVKYLGLFAIFTPTALADHLSRIMRLAKPRDVTSTKGAPRPAKRSKFLRRADIFAATTAYGVAALALFYCIVQWPFRADLAEDLPVLYPINACAALADAKITGAQGPIRVLTDFDYGGWCRWAIDQRAPGLDVRVTADNRTQLVSDRHHRETFELFGLQRQWLPILQRWNPDAAALSKDTPLAQVLALAKGEWRMAYQDDNFALFLRNR